MEEIVIDISPDGEEMRVEGKGIKGNACEQLTKELETAVGTVTSKQRTAEYYETPRVPRKVGA